CTAPAARSPRTGSRAGAKCRRTAPPMARPHVGLATLEGDLERYAEKYDLLELRPGDAAVPKASTLRAWRRKVPPSFVFSVVFPKPVSELKPSAALEAALEQSLAVAREVEARCLVIATPPS